MEKGETNTITIRNAFNAEFAKDRSTSDKTLMVSIVSPNGFVVAQSGIQESELPSLAPASISEASLTRESPQVGENEVTYEVVFGSPNAIQSGSYALLSLPRNEAELAEGEFDCHDARARNSMTCEVLEARDSHYIVKISNLCEY